MGNGVAASVAYFLLAGLMEIGGGYLMWIWLRDGKPLWVGLLGAAVLAGYGVVPTLQPAQFGRVYAAYGGVFVVLSLLWGWAVDRQRPDLWDWLGVVLCVLGVLAIMYTPRGPAAP